MQQLINQVTQRTGIPEDQLDGAVSGQGGQAGGMMDKAQGMPGGNK